jgi:hypothetical protein
MTTISILYFPFLLGEYPKRWLPVPTSTSCAGMSDGSHQQEKIVAHTPQVKCHLKRRLSQETVLLE